MFPVMPNCLTAVTGPRLQLWFLHSTPPELRLVLWCRSLLTQGGLNPDFLALSNAIGESGITTAPRPSSRSLQRRVPIPISPRLIIVLPMMVAVMAMGSSRCHSNNLDTRRGRNNRAGSNNTHTQDRSSRHCNSPARNISARNIPVPHPR